MIREALIPAALSALVLAAPALAEPEQLTPEHAMRRLDACLRAGAPGAPHSGLREAIPALRSLCLAQIHRVQADRVAAARQGLTGDAAKAAEDRAVRALNDEIARAIASYTGLTH